MFFPFRSSGANRTSYLGFIMILFVLLFYVFFYNKQTVRIESGYPTIAGLDLKVDYPATPEAVIDINNKLMLVMYNGGINDSEIALSILKQRELFADELLELNPLEQMIIAVTDNILENKKRNVFMTEIETNDIYMDDISENIAEAIVMQYINNDIVQEVTYKLIKQEGQWKILAWEYGGENE